MREERKEDRKIGIVCKQEGMRKWGKEDRKAFRQEDMRK